MGAYFSLEASLVMSVVIMLIIALLYLVFFFYDKCLIAQDIYLLAFRGTRMTGYESGGIEIIYGKSDVIEDTAIEGYLEERMKKLFYCKDDYIVGKYPMLLWEHHQYEVDSQIDNHRCYRRRLQVISDSCNKFPYGQVIKNITISQKTSSEYINPLVQLRMSKN